MTMLRKLLTLLAICAGLTAVAEPARAAVAAVESVHVLDQGAPAFAPRGASVVTAAALLPGHAAEKGKPFPEATVVVLVPTVVLQADRARE